MYSHKIVKVLRTKAVRKEADMDTAFDNKRRTLLGEDQDEGDTKVPKEWAYVGRFMWGFGKVEMIVNILFYDMYCQDANSVIVSFVLGNFDLRKKWRLLSNGLKRQKVKDYRQYSGKINELMDIRNSIAHG
jgi:hypothetical protein